MTDEARVQAIRQRGEKLLETIAIYPGASWPDAYEIEGVLLRDVHARRAENNNAPSPWEGGTLAASRFMAAAPQLVRDLLAELAAADVRAASAEQERDELKEQQRTSPQLFRVRLADELQRIKTEAWQWAQKLRDRNTVSVGEIASIASCLEALYWYGPEVYGDVVVARLKAAEAVSRRLQLELKEIGAIAGECRRSMLAEGHELPASHWIQYFAQIERLSALLSGGVASRQVEDQEPKTFTRGGTLEICESRELPHRKDGDS